jgi:hypothetical protein
VVPVSYSERDIDRDAAAQELAAVDAELGKTKAETAAEVKVLLGKRAGLSDARKLYPNALRSLYRLQPFEIFMTWPPLSFVQ